MRVLEQDFIKWVHSIDPKLKEFNPGSVQQLQQLLFAPCFRKISAEKFKKPNFRTTQKPQATIDPEENIEENPDEETEGNGNNGASRVIGKEFTNANPDDKLIELLPEERIFRVENIYVKIMQFF